MTLAPASTAGWWRAQFPRFANRSPSLEHRSTPSRFPGARERDHALLPATVTSLRKEGIVSDHAKQADLAGPGIGDYADLERVLPSDYTPVLNPRQTQEALYAVKRHIAEGLCRELDLMMVEVPLIVDERSGVNDMLDRDGSRTPVQFHISNDRGKNPIDAQVVQAATKWKRVALKQFQCAPGQGICTDMRAVRKDYFLDHDHSAYVDQWDWERVITEADRNLGFLTATVKKIWKVLKGAETLAHEMFPQLRDAGHPELPDELTFLHAEEILERYPDLPRKERETAILQEHPAVFIIGIGWPLADGYPHEMRAADYDDWVTETTSASGRPMHGLNGDILVWNPVTRRRHELTSMGVRVTKETLRKQLEMSGQLDFLELPYHQAILNDEIPLSIGGGIGQSRTTMLLLRKAHLGEVSVTVWPKVLKAMCARKNIPVLE
ncbi:MAG: aspartate--ammonia ligase [Planctomycetes bacterium]|nr:aspartate--ammonia ligase [Planctomycetota bacterium]